MFLVDDLLWKPVKGLIALCRRGQGPNCALNLEQDERTAGVSFSELQRLLEAGRISQKEFDAQEAKILDLLEEVREILQTLDHY